MEAYTVLYNPHAGGGHGEENAHRLEQLLPACALEFYDMSRIESYADFFGALAPDARVLLSGGDGTLNRFINDTASLQLSQDIWYFAGGTGNDFLRDVAQAGEAGPIPISRYLDALPQVTVRGRTYRFLNGVGYGIDGYCCEVGDRVRVRTNRPANYTAIAIKGLLFHYQPTRAVVTVDGVRRCYEKVWLAPTMHGRFYGGGMMPTPAQDRLSEAGTLSTMVFHGSGKLRTLLVFPSIFKGTHIRKHDVVEILTGRDITVEFDRPTALQIDGETVLDVSSYHAVAARVAAPCA